MVLTTFIRIFIMIYAYIRVSTDKQNVENQRHEILTYLNQHNIKSDKWIEEKISSQKRLKDRKLGKLLKHLKKGDILITTELSRLGRKLLEVMSILQDCMEKECQVWALKENYRLGADIQSKVLAFSFSLAAEIERQLISERTKNSLRRLKDEGKKLGRPYGMSYKKLEEEHDKLVLLLSKNISKAEIARSMNCSWITLHRYIKSCIKI